MIKGYMRVKVPRFRITPKCKFKLLDKLFYRNVLCKVKVVGGIEICSPVSLYEYVTYKFKLRSNEVTIS